ncbi:MAG: hypothetical protein PHN31_04485 [Candidatus Gracilibacteria bacterium]|nr:hypothetical protein [Candidatus Gracilibacteria bacterium]
MVETIINFLNSLNNFLKKEKSINGKSQKNNTFLYYFIITITVILILWNIIDVIWLIKEYLDITHYGSYENPIIFFSFFIYILTFSILLKTILLLNKTDGNYINNFYNIIIPSYFGIIGARGLFLFYPYEYSLYVFYIILLGYPLLQTIQLTFKGFNSNIYNKLKDTFYLYNLGFIFFVVINVFFGTIGINIEFLGNLSHTINDFFRMSYIDNFFEGFILLIFSFIILLLPIYLLHIYFDTINRKRKLFNISILLFLIVYIGQFTGNIINTFYQYQLQKAQNIISLKGNNYESYKLAKSIFLSSAYKNAITSNKDYDKTLFEKLYDSTPENYYGEKIAKNTKNNRNFSTNSSNIGEKANVILNLGEIENEIYTFSTTQSGSNIKTAPVIESTYRFHLQNETTINQEVVMFFETPSKNSVVTSLKLGLDLELNGQFSPRGAARQVYENSLIKNIDPALIEKVGLNTYSLRVFPVPSKSDKTQGKQLVEVKILSPINNNEYILYSPKISFINLKFNKKSSLISKIYNNENLIKEDIIKEKNLDEYLNLNHSINSNDLNIKIDDNLMNYCLDDKLNSILINYNLPINTINKTREIKNKTSLFFDNSLSVDRNNADKSYNSIYNAFKNYNGKLNDIDLYSYNFDVNKLSEIKDINFRGYSDIDRVIDYIINNKLSKENIVFITDDDNFNLSLKENKSRDLSKLITNKISIIKIGKNIKTYKSDLNTILSASQGNIYNLNNISEIEKIINTIKNNTSLSIKNPCKKLPDEDINAKKIQAGFVGNLLLSNIKNDNDWLNIAKAQSYISNNYSIVNQFNSLIVLQNIQQQRDLEYYKNNFNKYDSDYNNYESNQNSNFGSTRRLTINNIFPETNEDTSSIDYSSLDSTNFGIRIDSSVMSPNKIKGGLLGKTSINENYGITGSTNVSIFGIFLLIMKLFEFIMIYYFIKKYIKGEKK